MGVNDLECYQVLYGLAELIKPETYLEVGVREGASLCCVLAREREIVDFTMTCLRDDRHYLTDEIVERVADGFTPRRDLSLFLFDNWSYKGGEGGRERIVKLLDEGFQTGSYELIAGDSKETLPRFFDSTPRKQFPRGYNREDRIDLVFIDGDHSWNGAWADICNVHGHYKILVCHDLFHPEHGYLHQLFKNYVKMYELPHVIAGRNGYGTGIAFDIY